MAQTCKYVENTLILSNRRCCQDEVAVEFQETCQCPDSTRKSVSQRRIVFFAFHRCLHSETWPWHYSLSPVLLFTVFLPCHFLNLLVSVKCYHQCFPRMPTVVQEQKCDRASVKVFPVLDKLVTVAVFCNWSFVTGEPCWTLPQAIDISFLLSRIWQTPSSGSQSGENHGDGLPWPQPEPCFPGWCQVAAERRGVGPNCRGFCWQGSESFSPFWDKHRAKLLVLQYQIWRRNGCQGKRGKRNSLWQMWQTLVISGAFSTLD